MSHLVRYATSEIHVARGDFVCTGTPFVVEKIFANIMIRTRINEVIPHRCYCCFQLR